jgi:hypothetical protein
VVPQGATPAHLPERRPQGPRFVVRLPPSRSWRRVDCRCCYGHLPTGPPGRELERGRRCESGGEPWTNSPPPLRGTTQNSIGAPWPGLATDCERTGPGDRGSLPFCFPRRANHRGLWPAASQAGAPTREARHATSAGATWARNPSGFPGERDYPPGKQNSSVRGLLRPFQQNCCAWLFSHQ